MEKKHRFYLTFAASFICQMLASIFVDVLEPGSMFKAIHAIYLYVMVSVIVPYLVWLGLGAFVSEDISARLRAVKK